MRAKLTAAIAWRYLLSKKSHATVGTISTVSVCAMAVATAAIVCVLSVFNGFREVIASHLDTLSPDIIITPAEGKTLAGADSLTKRVARMPEVELATPTLQDNALVICNSQEMPVTVKGVIPGEYARVTSVRKLIGKEYGTYFDSVAPISNTTAVVAIGVAARLHSYPGDGMLIFAPKREGRVNLANPVSSFLTDSITVAGIYRSDQSQFDEDGVLMPIEAVRRLLQHGDAASAIEIKLNPGQNPGHAMNRICAELGDQYVVKDRMRQQETNFRMISIEKWVSFMLLGFILIIASFNIISSLSMLVLEKESALSTLTALGLSRRRIGDIFAWESIYVALAGGLSGILLGLVLCLTQQHFGLIKIGDAETTIVSAYPVRVEAADLLWTLLPVAVIGIITALVTAHFAKSRIRRL